MELGHQKEELLGSAARAQPNRKKQARLLFPGKDSANERPWTLFVYNFLFLSIKAFSLSCSVEIVPDLLWWLNPNYNSLTM